MIMSTDDLDEAIEYASESIEDVVLDVMKSADVEFDTGDEFFMTKKYIQRHLKEIIAQAIIQLEMSRNDEEEHDE